jgi:hypothetical protein
MTPLNPPPQEGELEGVNLDRLRPGIGDWRLKCHNFQSPIPENTKLFLDEA